jgi:hypothetical protein
MYGGGPSIFFLAAPRCSLALGTEGGTRGRASGYVAVHMHMPAPGLKERRAY